MLLIKALSHPPTYVPTGDMTADLLTKALPRLKVEQFWEQMGLGAFRGN
jgi:hypothetical protein